MANALTETAKRMGYVEDPRRLNYEEISHHVGKLQHAIQRVGERKDRVTAAETAHLHGQIEDMLIRLSELVNGHLQQHGKSEAVRDKAMSMSRAGERVDNANVELPGIDAPRQKTLTEIAREMGLA